jgi:cytochrome d ubiquinol oxidase subunit II
VYSISSITLSLLLGVVLGNVLQGMPINEQGNYVGSTFWGFLTPFPLLVGVSAVALFMTHGAIYLLLKTEGRLYSRISISLRRSIIFFILSFVATSLYALLFIPHLTEVFKTQPIWLIFPVLAILSIANLPRLAVKRNYQMAFIFSSISILFLFSIVAINLYPNLLISTIDSKYNISIYNSASSEKSLGIMLLMAAIGTPLVLGYTAFVYFTFRGKVKLDDASY